MARIDIERRAQIGRDRRARTRAQLIEAARALYARKAIELVTVDDVIGEAGVAKGTFYVHFPGLGDLQAAVADELAREFDELVRPRQLGIEDALERIALGCEAFVAEAVRDPAWGALVARSVFAMPEVARGVQGRLSEDIRAAVAGGRIREAPELAFELVIGIVLRAMLAASEGRIGPGHVSGVVAGILRAIDAAPAEARALAAPKSSPPPSAPTAVSRASSAGSRAERRPRR